MIGVKSGQVSIDRFSVQIASYLKPADRLKSTYKLEKTSIYFIGVK